MKLIITTLRLFARSGTERAVDYYWRVVSEQLLGDELRDHGLTLRHEAPAEMGMYAITR